LALRRKFVGSHLSKFETYSLVRKTALKKVGELYRPPCYFWSMKKNDLLDEIGQRMASLLPMAEELSGDTKAKLNLALKRALADMDILSREEFDAQADALRRAEQRIDELETSLARLEESLAAAPASSAD
jgi:BMFP domain-containing protein YqiC